MKLLSCLKPSYTVNLLSLNNMEVDVSPLH